MGTRMIVRRAERMANTTDASVAGSIVINDTEVELPSPLTWDALKRKTSALGPTTKINIQNLNGKPEAVNELLDFTVKSIPPEGLYSVYFENWLAISGLEIDIFAMMANKATTLKELSICYM